MNACLLVISQVTVTATEDRTTDIAGRHTYVCITVDFCLVTATEDITINLRSRCLGIYHCTTCTYIMSTYRSTRVILQRTNSMLNIVTCSTRTYYIIMLDSFIYVILAHLVVILINPASSDVIRLLPVRCCSI